MLACNHDATNGYFLGEGDMTDKYTKKVQGFTLVELSIVIIIIGFLIAGIAAGQSLIKQVRLNSLISDITEMSTAVNTFKTTYGYLPGDFPNAITFWPNEICRLNGVRSCDGNGNGLIETGLEFAFAWDHLNQSKIMQSTFYPYTAFPTDYPTLYKLLRYGQGAVAQISQGGSTTYGKDLMNTNELIIMSHPNYDNLFTPADLSSVDNKMDDGNPSSGRLLAMGFAFPGCTVEADGITPISSGVYPHDDAKYALSNNNLGCSRIEYLLD